VQSLVIHPADHQYLAGVVLLDDGGHQTGGIALEPVGDPHIQLGVPRLWVYGHASILPCATRRR
jgi:hypothetical protein